MALLQKSTILPKKLGVASPAEKLGLSLPMEVSEPVHDINAYHGVITGEPGIGKTTLGMQEPGVFLLSYDPAAKSLAAFQRHCPDWKTFIGYLDLLESASKKPGLFPYSRILVDGADLWYRSCHKAVCEKLCIEHPADEAWGKGWDAITQTFTSAVDRLLRMPCGVWFICHAKYKELEKRDGTKEEKLRPLLVARAEEILVGKCDFMLNIHYRGDIRIGTIRGSEDIAAKNRIDNHFLTPDNRQVVEIVMGNQGPQVAWETFLNAFNNLQDYTTYDELEAAAEPNQTTVKPAATGGPIKKGGGLLKPKK